MPLGDSRLPQPPAPATPAAGGRGRAGAASGVRLGVLALGGACLLAGLDAALILLGVWAPVPAGHLPDVHGMVMVLGFMGTLIALERAQALGAAWAMLAPAVLGAGGIALVAGLPATMGQLLLLEGCLLFLGVYLALWRRAPLALVGVQLLGVVLATAAAALWLVVDVAAIIPLLAGFLVLTIAAERAELAQLVMGRRAVPTLVTLAVAVALAATASLLWPDAAARLLGAVLVLTAAWLVRDDAPRRLIRTTTGLRRYTAAALLAGYGWLAVAGLAWLVAGPAVGRTYDVVVHATFLGFGVSMIMAHAPTILPAVLGRPLPYHPSLWAPLGLLHLGMVTRIGGDVADAAAVWRVGSVVTVVAVLAFLAVALLRTARA